MADRDLLVTLKRVASVLKQTGVPFALAGGFAVYAHGGTASDHDVDFLLRERDVDQALDALDRAGFRTERPPEDWLVKVYDGDLLVDLIFRPVEHPVTDETLADTKTIRVQAISLPVLSATTLMVHKMLTFSQHNCDFADALPMARSLREQIDWTRVRMATAASPYAKAFLVLLGLLDLVPEPTAVEERVMATDDYTEAAVRRLLSENSAVADQAVEVVRREQTLVLRGEVESDRRRQDILRLVRDNFPELMVRDDIGVTRYQAPEEAEELR